MIYQYEKTAAITIATHVFAMCRPEVPAIVGGLWRVVLPKGYLEPGVPGTIAQPASGCRLLAWSDHHERLPGWRTLLFNRGLRARLAGKLHLGMLQRFLAPCCVVVVSGRALEKARES
jgi:hypothetical protein